MDARKVQIKATSIVSTRGLATKGPLYSGKITFPLKGITGLRVHRADVKATITAQTTSNLSGAPLTQ